jgi:hypothetical protein
MKPHIQKLPLSEQSSFVADKFVTPYFETGWHYHPEYELVLMIKEKVKDLSATMFLTITKESWIF